MRNKLLLGAAFLCAVLTSASVGYTQGPIRPRPRPGGGGIIIPACNPETICSPCTGGGRGVCCTYHKYPDCSGNTPTGDCFCVYEKPVCRPTICV